MGSERTRGSGSPRSPGGGRDTNHGGNNGGRGGLPAGNELALPLPRSMASAIEAQRQRLSDTDNVGLWMDKLVYRRAAGWLLKEDVRRFCLQQFCRKWTSDLGRAAAERLAGAIPLLHCAHRSGTAKLNTRLLIGQGRAAATETSLTFHPIWGVPVIPGSALKGLARAALVEELSDDELRELFGDNERVGRLTFYDAVPLRGQFTLALDGQTPHHGRYYGTDGDDGVEPIESTRASRGAARVVSTAPTDADSPVPFSFLTVVKTDFMVYLGARDGSDRNQEAHDNNQKARIENAAALDKVWTTLMTALADLGIGGKTSAGYGRFERLPPPAGKR